MEQSRIIAKDTRVIPYGPYCYRLTSDNDTDEAPRIPRSAVCPYWSFREDKPRQENGYCGFMESGDWESEGMSLLWDQVKECGINQEIDE
jgi:hypothetical protein